MKGRAEQVLLAIIDDALGVTAERGRLTNVELVDVLLDLRLAVIEISSLDRILSSTPPSRPVAGVRG